VVNFLGLDMSLLRWRGIVVCGRTVGSGTGI